MQIISFGKNLIIRFVCNAFCPVFGMEFELKVSGAIETYPKLSQRCPLFTSHNFSIIHYHFMPFGLKCRFDYLQEKQNINSFE